MVASYPEEPGTLDALVASYPEEPGSLDALVASYPGSSPAGALQGKWVKEQQSAQKTTVS